MESNQQTCLEIKISADGKPLEFVIESFSTVDMSCVSQAFLEAIDMSCFSQAFLKGFERVQDETYYAEQEHIADDVRWQNDPLEIKQHLEIIWNDILCNASDLFHMLGDICNDLSDRLYPYD